MSDLREAFEEDEEWLEQTLQKIGISPSDEVIEKFCASVTHGVCQRFLTVHAARSSALAELVK